MLVVHLDPDVTVELAAVVSVIIAESESTRGLVAVLQAPV
jgi:hypothetical protein